MSTKPELTLRQICNMCVGFLGIQFAFSLQNADISRIFQTLGANLREIPILWVAAPLSGLIVQPIIGYGGIGSATNNNRAIQQGELVIAHTMWKNPQYGAFVMASDSSYVTRAPWFVAPNAPKNAHMFMTKIDFKYVLP